MPNINNRLKSILKTLAKILGVVVFSDGALDKIKKLKINFGALLFITVLILSAPKFPSSFDEIKIEIFLFNFFINFVSVLAFLAILITALYLISRSLGSTVMFKDYFFSLTLLMLIISFLSFIMAFLLLNFGMVIGYSEVAFKLIQGSFITYYFFVVFAWGAERLAGFDELKGVVVGIAALTLNYAFHLALSSLP